MTEKPLVSILCATYNQKDFIAQTIEGFLMQKVNFPIEIIVHDDASTDGSATIIQEFASRYPSIIKPIFEKLKSIVIAEGFEFDQEKQQLVLNIIKNCYPKIRNMIKTLQKAISTNSLDIAGAESSYEEILNTLKTKDYPKLIEQVNSLTNPDGMFEFLYSRVSEFSKLPNAVQSLAKGQFQSSMVRDKNLNLASTLCELTMCV